MRLLLLALTGGVVVGARSQESGDPTQAVAPPDSAAAHADSAGSLPGESVVEVVPIDPLAEYLRLDRATIPLGQESDQLWAVMPGSITVVDGLQEAKKLSAGPAYQGAVATLASTSRGWLLGTTEGVWEMRLNDFDVRFLPELEAEGVYRFDQEVAFTRASLYRLDAPWERYPFRDFSFLDVNDIAASAETLLVATRQGLRRFLWGRRVWDDAPFGKEAEHENVIRFLPPQVHNQIESPDSSVVHTLPLLVGAYHVLYEQPGSSSREWRAVDGLLLDPPRRPSADSTYRRIPRLLFQDDAKGPNPSAWRRWLVGPATVCRLELPDGAVPFSTGRFSLRGETHATFEEKGFVWIATSADLWVIDREYQSVYRFFEEPYDVWGFMGRPLSFTRSVEGEERGWYALTSRGMIEVFLDSWAWESYGPDRLDVREVLCTASDDDGFWIGTKKGLKWFGADRREWDPARPPAELRTVEIFKLEWHRNNLYAVTAAGLFAKTRHSLAWAKISTAS